MQKRHLTRFHMPSWKKILEENRNGYQNIKVSIWEIYNNKRSVKESNKTYKCGK